MYSVRDVDTTPVPLDAVSFDGESVVTYKLLQFGILCGASNEFVVNLLNFMYTYVESDTSIEINTIETVTNNNKSIRSIQLYRHCSLSRITSFTLSPFRILASFSAVRPLIITLLFLKYYFILFYPITSEFKPFWTNPINFVERFYNVGKYNSRLFFFLQLFLQI